MPSADTTRSGRQVTGPLASMATVTRATATNKVFEDWRVRTRSASSDPEPAGKTPGRRSRLREHLVRDRQSSKSRSEFLDGVPPTELSLGHTRQNGRAGPKTGSDLLAANWQPQRDSNPCLHLERVMS